MKAYIKDLPGRVHEMKEDAHCSSFLTDSDGTAWGLFMVADGLSGYDGSIASNVAVRSILYTITDALQKPGSKKYAEIIKNSIIKAHQRLEKRGDTFTTLSLALASEDDLYIAHLGDGCVRLVYEDTSTIITPEENKRGIPSNYLGKAFLSDKPIEERINLFQPYREGKKKPLGLQLETDGLTSRLAEKEIKEILLKAKEYDEPSTILQMYEQRVIIPERRLLELPAGKLKRYLGDVPNFSIPDKLSPEEVVSYVISAYRLRDNTELADIIDNSLLKYDDTTVIYVDLQEITRGKMAQLQQTVADLQSNKVILDLRAREIKLQRELEQTGDKTKSLEEKAGQLQTSNERLKQSLKEAAAKIDHLNNLYTQLKAKRDKSKSELRRQLQSKSEEMTALENRLTEAESEKGKYLCQH